MLRARSSQSVSRKSNSYRIFRGRVSGRAVKVRNRKSGSAEERFVERLIDEELLVLLDTKKVRRTTMENRDLDKVVVWLKRAVVVAGTLLEISGVLTIVMYLQRGASITLLFDLTISGLVLGILFVLFGFVLQVTSILKLRRPSERQAKSKSGESAAASSALGSYESSDSRHKSELHRPVSELKEPRKETQYKSRLKRLSLLATILILLILVSGSAAYWFLATPTSIMQPVIAYSTDQEIKDAAKEVSDRVSLISLINGGVTLKDDERPRAQYTININAKYGDEYFFKTYEYWIQTGGDVSEMPTVRICNTIDEFFNRKDKVLEALRELRIKGSLSFPLWRVNAGFEVDNIQAVIIEFLYALRRFYELKTKRVEILIKGYADGWKGKEPWTRPLKPKRYHFDQIIVYPAVHPDSMNPVEYFRTDTPITIPPKYGNQHLPDLRGNFVKVDLVEPFLAQCKDVKNKEIHILKGYEFSKDVIDRLKRKAQVFVNIY